MFLGHLCRLRKVTTMLGFGISAFCQLQESLCARSLSLPIVQFDIEGITILEDRSVQSGFPEDEGEFDQNIIQSISGKGCSFALGKGASERQELCSPKRK